MTSTLVIGILGATGGIGASTLAVALSLQLAAPHRTTVCLDARPYGGGLDVTWAAEHLPGLRWPDLTHITHDPDTEATVRELPHVAGVTLVSHSLAQTPALEVKQATELAQALANSSDATVIDLPRLGEHDAQAWWNLCTDIVVLLPCHPAGLTASLHLQATTLPQHARTWAVQRISRGATPGTELAESIGVPYLTALGEHPLTARRSQAGLLPVHPRSPHARCAARISAAVLGASHQVAA